MEKIKIKKFQKLTLIVSLLLLCFIFNVQPAHAAVTYGDVSSDGDITAYDAALTAQYVVGLTSLASDQLQSADTSGDSQVTAFDAALIAQYTVGLITRFPAEDKTTNNILVPGTGFTGPTAQPAPVGDPTAAGYDAKAIARWDVVPYQTIDSAFNVGVVAFHMNEIDRVEFSVNGGAWVAVREPSLNPQTANHSGIGMDTEGVVEYWATLDASKFTVDGPAEVRAIAYPKIGVPRVLQEDTTDPMASQLMFLYIKRTPPLVSDIKYVSFSGDDTNPGTIDLPYKTLMRGMNQVPDGGTIILKDPGEWILPTSIYDHRPNKYGGNNYAGGSRDTNKRWITVKAADGLKPEDIVIRLEQYGTYSPYFNLLKWEGISFDGHYLQYYDLWATFVWFDHCRWFNSTGWLEQLNSPIRARYYATNSLAEDIVYGFTNATLVQNCTLKRISGDAFQHSQMVVNCTGDTFEGTETVHHADVMQVWLNRENMIFYKFRGTNLEGIQNIYANFNDPHNSFDVPNLWNSAFVDLDFENRYDSTPYSQFWNQFEHVLFKNVRWHNQRLMFRTDANPPFTAKNVIFDSCILHPSFDSFLKGTTAMQGVIFKNCSLDTINALPVRSHPLPKGGLLAGTNSAMLGLSTDIPCTCKYALTSGLPYQEMPYPFMNTGTTEHSTKILDLQDNQSYTYYVRCQDQFGNSNLDDFSISFAVLPPTVNGLLARWTFDSADIANTTAVDISGNNNHGTLMNAPVSVAGKLGEALQFDGEKSYMKVGIFKGSLASRGTYAFWLHYDRSVPNTRFVDSGGYTPIRINDTNGSLRVSIFDASGVRMYDSTSSRIPIGEWVHYAVTYNLTQMAVYKNGILEVMNTTPASTTVADINGEILTVGGSIFSSGVVPGAMDDVRIYNRSLTGEEVLNLYTNGDSL